MKLFRRNRYSTPSNRVSAFLAIILIPAAAGLFTTSGYLTGELGSALLIIGFGCWIHALTSKY